MKYTPEFWEEYKQYHKGTGDHVAQEVKRHFKMASLWTRKALNSVTQRTGCIILKHAVTKFFRWIVDEGLFGKVMLSDLVHDEVVIEFPESMKDTVPAKLKQCMEESASEFCKKLPIPAEAEIGDCWIH
jgi:DNA polymerase I-like protein with 3'-5' exonuclease and polymerase domains